MAPENGSGEKKIYLSLTGLPLTFDLQWPFHRSTSGSDWYVLHGTITVVHTDGLRASVAVNLSATVAEVMPSLEPRDAETPVINALRKEVDRKQIEFLKSGKLLPIHFSSRHYNFRTNHWTFERATDEQIAAFVQRKVYWETLAGSAEVWIADTTDAQYLDTTTQHLSDVAKNFVNEGLWTMERAYARANAKLMSQAARFQVEMETALAELEHKHAFERG